MSPLRQREAKPILDRFSDWLMEQQRRSLPASGFGQAVRYAINQRPTLIRYVDDGSLSPDNGVSEHAIRPLAVGRINWLFIGQHDAERMRESIQDHLNPWHNLNDAMTQACQSEVNIEPLLPDCWQP